MIEGRYGAGTVDIYLVHLASGQQHGRTVLAKGGIPCTLCHDALLDNQSCKVVVSAVSEVELSRSVFHKITSAADGSLQ